MKNSQPSFKALRTIEDRAEARRMEAERWQALWDEVRPTEEAAPEAGAYPPKAPGRVRSILSLFRRD